MQWTPRTRETAGCAAVGLVLAVVAVGLDPVGRVLVGAAAVLLLVLAARDLVLRPRLAGGPDGVVVRRLGPPVTIGWDRLRASVRTTRRLGTSSRTLELEDAADDTLLVVLGRRDLGADPGEVARALWARGRGQPPPA